MRRPLSNFRTEEENDKDIEDTFVKTPVRGRKSWRKWWDTVRREGYTSLDGCEAQLLDGYDVTQMRKKTCSGCSGTRAHSRLRLKQQLLTSGD
jgi:hypothetical protein